MKTKILVSSLLVTALLAGCSNEEYLGNLFLTLQAEKAVCYAYL